MVVIPDIVMNHLEMPEALAGAGIERKQAIAEQIGALSVGAVEVVFGTADGNVDDAALLIDGEFAPGVCAADRFPGIFRPGVVSEFAGMRNGVEDPDQLPVRTS